MIKTIKYRPQIQRKKNVKHTPKKISSKSNSHSNNPIQANSLESKLSSSRDSGIHIPQKTRSYMERRFGADFNFVRLHTGSNAIQMNEELNAQAFTYGNDIFFNKDKYSPETSSGKHLIAHELTHVVQQNGNISGKLIQREEMPGHDLTAPFWAGESEMEKVYDGEDLIKFGDKGSKVTTLQNALVKLGHTLPIYGVDGKFGNETRQKVVDFQTKAGFSWKERDGIAGKKTVYQMDRSLREGTTESDKDETKNDYEVLDLPPNAFLAMNQIFFYKSSSEIPPDETAKIHLAKVLLKGSNLIVEGCASDEGDASFNEKLSKKRADAVKTELENAGFENVKIKLCEDLNNKNIKYAEARRATIIPDTPEGTSKIEDCPLGDKATGICKDEVEKEISRISGLAKEKVKKALEHFPLKTNNDKELLKKVFNTDSSNFDSTESSVKKILEDSTDYLGKLPDKSKHKCVCRGDISCKSNSVAYVMKGTDVTNFCPVLMDDKDDKQKIGTLIHETHHVVNKNSDDYAYNIARLIRVLSNKDSINNADSVTVFVEILLDPGEKFGPAQDFYAGFKDDEKKKIDYALALNQNWLFETRKILHYTFEHIQEVRRAKVYDKDHLEGQLFEFYMFLADRVDLTKPPKLPKDSDEQKFAAFYDRVIRMLEAYNSAIDIKRNNSDNTFWKNIESSPELTVGISLPKEDKIKVAGVFLQEVIAACKNISSELEPEYNAMVYKARKLRNLEPY